MAQSIKRLLGKRVVIRKIKGEGVTEGGIIIADTVARLFATAEVVLVGDEVPFEKVAVGDKVLYPESCNTPIKHNNEELTLIHLDDIQLVLD